MLQGFSGQLDGWLARKPFEPLFVERLDAMFAAGDCPDAVVVFVDAWTSLGGSQFLNSTATGNYMDYLCDEVVPFVDAGYPDRAGTRERRAVTGHSSGGYGALVLPMLRPDIFGALVAHAPDTLFEASYMSGFPARRARAARSLRRLVREAARRTSAQADRFDWGRWGEALNAYAMAAAYSPDPERPGKVLLPFDTRHREADRGDLGALARARPGADGATSRASNCAVCATSTSRPGAPTSTCSTSAAARSQPSSTRSGSSTASSSSTAATAASPTATRRRSASCC